MKNFNITSILIILSIIILNIYNITLAIEPVNKNSIVDQLYYLTPEQACDIINQMKAEYEWGGNPEKLTRVEYYKKLNNLKLLCNQQNNTNITNTNYQYTSSGTYITPPDIKRTLKPTDIYNSDVSSMVYISTQSKQGSGVIIQEDGTFVTCFHVIENANYINVKTHDNKTFKVNGFKYINPTEDIAILTIDAPYTKFRPIGINHNPLQIGEKVYTISNPEGLEFTFSDGMINQYKNEYIQFSAPISSGSSGGALLNEKGELIGIITSTLKESQNINFAIPNEYYIPNMNNLTIKNTFNQDWTKFLLSETNNNQFKINTNYKDITSTSFEKYYYRCKDYVNLQDFPSQYYALVAYIAYMAYLETEEKGILDNAIKWYELSIINSQNIEVSAFALSSLYAIKNETQKLERIYLMLSQFYPASFKVIEKVEDTAELEIYYKHLIKLTKEIYWE